MMMGHFSALASTKMEAGYRNPVSKTRFSFVSSEEGESRNNGLPAFSKNLTGSTCAKTTYDESKDKRRLKSKEFKIKCSSALKVISKPKLVQRSIDFRTNIIDAGRDMHEIISRHSIVSPVVRTGKLSPLA